VDKKRNAQNLAKSRVSVEQAKKLDELAEKIQALPADRKEAFNDLLSDLSKRLFSSTEVCEILGVSIAALRRWIKDEKIRFVRVAKYIKFPRDEVLRMQQNMDSLGLPEVAVLFGVGEMSVRNMIARGEIQALRHSDKGHWRISKSEVERIIAGNPPVHLTPIAETENKESNISVKEATIESPGVVKKPRAKKKTKAENT